MLNISALIEWYYKADYTFFWRKRYEVMLADLEKCSLAKARKVICNITRKKEILNLVAESLYGSEQGQGIKAVNSKYVDMLEQIEPKVLSWRQWDCLRFLLCSKGLFQMAHICRNNAVYRLKKNKGTYGILRRFAYDVENGNYEEAAKLIRSKKFLLLKIFAKERYEKCKDICITLGGKRRIDDFGEYIAHKRIVVLGPAQHDKGFLDYEKGKDIIVRFGYRGKEYLPECDKEIPTDISYVNGEFERYLKQNELEKLKSELKYTCYKRMDVRKKSKDFPKERNIYMFEPGAMFGQVNMVHNVIFDCLHYEAESIYVRNCNLYMAKNCYDDKYSIKSKNYKVLFYAFAKHDYEGQFNSLKSLYYAEKFQCDEECKNVLSLPVEEYIKKMEEIYMD